MNLIAHTAGSGTPIVSGAVDDGMAYAVLPWAYSLHTRASTPPHFVIGFLEGSLSAGNREALRSALEFLSISHEFVLLEHDARFIRQGHISPTTFTKFQLADLLPGQHVWIDIDTVATPRWDDIFSEISGAPSTAHLIVAARGDQAPALPVTTAQPSDLAFNAGVLGWPARKRIPWSGALDDAHIVETQEQSLFNTLYGKHLFTVSERFNTLTYRYDRVDYSELPLITHYAGAHKPWHVPRRFSRACLRHHCPWSLWFQVEKELLAKLETYGKPLEVARLRSEALRSGDFGLSGDQRGRALLHILRFLGPFGWIPVVLAKPFRRFIPRGTHPLH